MRNLCNTAALNQAEMAVCSLLPLKPYYNLECPVGLSCSYRMRLCLHGNLQQASVGEFDPMKIASGVSLIITVHHVRISVLARPIPKGTVPFG